MSWAKWTTLLGKVIQVGNINQSEIADKPLIIEAYSKFSLKKYSPTAAR
jgi:hypothetical protein